LSWSHIMAASLSADLIICTYYLLIIPIAMSDGVVLSKCFAGGVGCGLIGLITSLCVIKVRNQQFGPTDARYRTFRGTASSILREEGARGFGKGVGASVLRECTYSALRMGLYEKINLRYMLALDGGDETSLS
jgi:hypothetical protein